MINLTNVQRFSLHDGPGIRTTVFLKGCILRCPWCANPENILPQQQKYIKDGKEGIYGNLVSSDELFTNLMKDKNFYEGGGGVTFSGGEPLLQQRKLYDVFKKLHAENIHIAVESCLFVEDISIALEFIDLFIIDLKILDYQYCRAVEKGKLTVFFKSFKKVMDSGKPVIIRIPVIGGYTDGIDNQRLIFQFLDYWINNKHSNILRIELIKEHNLGLTKYKSIHAIDSSFPIPNYQGVDDQVMQDYKRKIRNVVCKNLNKNIDVEICKI